MLWLNYIMWWKYKLVDMMNCCKKKKKIEHEMYMLDMIRKHEKDMNWWVFICKWFEYDKKLLCNDLWHKKYICFEIVNTLLMVSEWVRYSCHICNSLIYVVSKKPVSNPHFLKSSL